MHTWIHSWKLLWNLKITQLQSGNSSEPNLHDFGFQPFIWTQDTRSMFLVPPSPSYGATSGSRSSRPTTDSGASQNIVVYYHPRPHWVGVALPFKKNGTIEQWRNNVNKKKHHQSSPQPKTGVSAGVSLSQLKVDSICLPKICGVLKNTATMDSMKLILLTQLLSLVMSARLNGMQEENQQALAHGREEGAVVSGAHPTGRFFWNWSLNKIKEQGSRWNSNSYFNFQK